MAAAFGLGGLLLVCAGLLPGGREKIAPLWRLYRSEFAIVGGVLVPLACGTPGLLLLALAIAWRGAFEMFELFGAPRLGTVRLVCLLAGLGLVLVSAFAPNRLVPGFGAAVLAVVVAGLATGRGAVPALLYLLFPVLPLVLMLRIDARPGGFGLIFLAYVTVETNDAFALLAGKLAGRHHALPRLSPGKTLEGFAGGIVAGGLTGYAIARMGLGFPSLKAAYWVSALLAAGIAGDLATSALKRWRGRKDFAPLAIAHGGVLDVLDSVLSAMPALLLLAVRV